VTFLLLVPPKKGISAEQQDASVQLKGGGEEEGSFSPVPLK